MSIGAKLNALVILAVVLALGPYAAYSLIRASEAAHEAAKAEFGLIGSLAVNVIQEGYLAHVSRQVEAAGDLKAALRAADGDFSRLASDLGGVGAEASRRILSGQLAEARSRGVEMFRLERSGRPAALVPGEGSGAGPAASFLNWGTAADITGQGLVDKMASGRVPPEGDFVVIDTPGRGRKGGALLALLRPEPGGDFVVSLASLDEARRRADLGRGGVVRLLSDRLDDVELPPGASIVLFDGARSSLLSIGPVPDLDPLSDELLERAGREGRLEVTVDFPDPAGPMLARLERFAPLDWHLAILVPQSAVSAPVRRQAKRLALWAVLGAAAAYLLSSYLGRGLSGPVSALARRAEQAAGLDFSSPEAAAFFEGDQGARAAGGEIGRLSDSFDSMGRTIVANVEALLAAGKAKERLDGELAAARAIQMGILPVPEGLDLPDGIEASFSLEPAKEVGGDLYEIFATPDHRVALVIGDVSGKGVPAALFMSVTLTLVRAALRESGLSPAETLTRVNRHLSARNPGAMFVTLLVALLDPLTGVLEYANGGHCRPLVLGSGGARSLVGLSGPVVGVLEDVEYSGFLDRLEPGETILMYTDGVTEAQDLAGAFFGLERLEPVAAEAALEGGPAIVCGRLRSAVEDFRGEAPPYDDVALLALRPNRPAGPEKP